MFVSLAVLVLLAASAQANLQDLSHGFPCKEVTNPRDEYKVCSYNGQNETMFHMLRSGDASNGPFVGTGLNGTDNFVVAWRSTHGKGMLKLIDGTGAIVKDMVLSEDAGDSMPAVAPLSGQGFAVAITTCQGDVKTATYDNNGTVIMDWQLLNLNDIVAAPTVTGISEDRFVVLAKDNLNQLWASVWYKTERISAFKATADAESYRAVALSGDSYVIMTKSSANDVYLLAFRALSQEKYTLENIEANGVIARGADGVALSALVDNHFTAVVTRTPEIKLYTYHFKDAKLLRAGNNQQDVRITTPQTISGVVHVTDAATPARVAFRENGFVVTYGDTSQRFKAVVFQRQGVANGTVVTVHKGPVTDAGGFAVGAGTQGFAASHANTDGSTGVAFFAPADFGELVRADDESSDGDRKRANAKRQATTVADASATAASESTSTAADASSTAAPATTTTTTTTVAATTTTTTAAATTTTTATTDDAADPTTTTTTSAAAATTTTMTMVAEDESFAGAVEAPLLFATSTGNVVALWLSDEPQADADAIVGFNAHVTLYSADGETIATSQLVDDGSVAKVDELLVDSDCSGAAALAAQLLAALVALLAALL